MTLGNETRLAKLFSVRETYHRRVTELVVFHGNTLFYSVGKEIFNIGNDPVFRLFIFVRSGVGRSTEKVNPRKHVSVFVCHLETGM